MNRIFNTDLGDKLIKHADRLKLDLWKGDDGAVVVNYELHGSTGNVDQDCEVTEPADMQFVADLIREFRKGAQ